MTGVPVVLEGARRVELPVQRGGEHGAARCV